MLTSGFTASMSRLARVGAGLMAAAGLSLAATGVSAQAYPTRPVSIVVPFAAGGPTDTVARNLADAMNKVVPNANFIIENLGGAGGTIGVAKVARAPADGYTLLLHHIGMSTAPALYRRLSFDPTKDFEYIGLINVVPMTFLTRNGFPAKNMKDMVAYVKANKNKVTLANAGIGAASHLCGLLFMSAIDTDLTTVPYKGTAPAMTDLMGGQVDLLCDQTSNTTQQILAGKVQALAVTTPQRLKTLPNIPTMTEAGYPGINETVWHALYAPKGTPKPVVDKLVNALQQSLKNPELLKRFADLGAQTATQEEATPAYLQKFLNEEIAKWTPIIRKAGIYAD